ncbi:MAG: hypothetical protein LBI43_06425 [Streptococcaceae bacterium]|nr:hypothetical protein [Streptococcaceae bacterium]
MKKIIKFLVASVVILFVGIGINVNAYYAKGTFTEKFSEYQLWTGKTKIADSSTYHKYNWVVNHGIYSERVAYDISYFQGGHALYQQWQWWAN